MKLNISKVNKKLLLILIFVLPFNFHYILNFESTQDFLFFKENLNYSLYLFDLLFLIILPLWLITRFKSLKNKGLLFLIIIYLLINSFFVAANFYPALYSSMRILEVLLFFLIFLDLAKSKVFFDKTAYLIFISGVLQSIIAFSQFFIQKSLRLKYLGESVLGPEILGVAKLEINGEKIIRGYGTFPHPNLLGAFLFIAFIAGLYFTLKKDPETPFNLPKQFKFKSIFLDLIKKIHFRIGLMIIFIGIVVTFSRSIWLITVYLLFLLTLKYFKYLFNKRVFLKYLLPIAIFLFITIIGFYQFIPARVCTVNCQDQSFSLRQNYLHFSKTIIKHNFILGIGPGQFSSEFKKINPTNLAEWNIQPVHNFYLLVWSEVGLIGFFLLFIFISKHITTINLSFHNELFLIAFGGFLLLGFFDHYFWTLPQGQFIFWLTLALLISSGKIKSGI
jgi:O-antigen ligase